MDNERILVLIKQALVEVAPTRKNDFEDIALATRIDALGLDSIATMEMVGFIEEQVDTTFPDEDLTNVNSLGDLANLIQTHGT